MNNGKDVSKHDAFSFFSSPKNPGDQLEREGAEAPWQEVL